MSSPDLILHKPKIATFDPQHLTVSAAAMEGGGVPPLEEINGVSDYFAF